MNITFKLKLLYVWSSEAYSPKVGKYSGSKKLKTEVRKV